LKVTKEKAGPCEYTLIVELDEERLETPLREAAQRLSKRRPLAGFRPGKAPYAYVERAYGKPLIVDEMLNEIGNDVYKEALEEATVEPYDRANFEIVQLEPLILKITVPTPPQVKLGDYGAIKVDEPRAEVTDEEVQKALEAIQEQQALWVPADRHVELGDQVIIDAHGTADDGHEIHRTDLELLITETLMPLEFRSELMGTEVGDNREFDITYAEDFGDQDLAGKRVHFRVEVKAVKTKEVPALDDALAQSVGEHESLDELRSAVRENLLQRKQNAAREDATEKALDALVALTDLEYPAVAVEQETEVMIQSMANRLSQQGFTLEGYLHTTGKTLEQFRDETRPRAETRLKRSLALGEFSDAEGIRLEKSDIDQKVDEMVSEFGDQADEARKAFGRAEVLASISSDLYNEKVIDRLLAIATGRVQPGEVSAVEADTESEPVQDTPSEGESGTA